MVKRISFIDTYIRLVRSGMSPAEAYKETNLNIDLMRTEAKEVLKRKKPTSDTKKEKQSPESKLGADLPK